MEFGETLRKIRKSHGLSLDGLSMLCGMHKSNLCKLEKADLPPPRSLEAMEKLLERTGFNDIEKFDLIQAAYLYHANLLDVKFKRVANQ